MKKMLVVIIVVLAIAGNVSAMKCKQIKENGYMITACHFGDKLYSVRVVDMVGNTPGYNTDFNREMITENVDETIMLLLESEANKLSPKQIQK